MKVFVTGATGVLGRSAIPRFLDAGHEVTGVARDEQKAELVGSLGATPAKVDIFDPEALTRAVAGHEIVCHLASHIPATSRAALARSWRENTRIWGEGGRNVVDAALAAGASAYIHQSSGFMYAEGGDRWLDEDTPLEPPPHGLVVLDGEREARRFAEGGGRGVSLRFGFFYGPTAGTTLDFIRAARIMRISVPGRPEAYYSSIHTEDLGTACAAALNCPSGTYNIIEDEPLTRRQYAEAFAAALGVRRLRVPRTPRIRRFDYILRSQRVSNRKFKDATGWGPSYPSVREGWRATLSQLTA